ncbi:twin-arginine translocation signal domain-containing protein [Halobium salinum]|uniref:Twin-arginine translocation signal domain-containing protein n=1 Tax=Halobium salinum TaxID=1364940 RepID=A0ABD5PEP9_9EURY|nr:twin-arginine translocation signal domain-containing protein [Halobium salinum]
MNKTPNRRQFLKATAATGITGIAGCTDGSGQTDDNTTTPPNDDDSTPTDTPTETSTSTSEPGYESQIKKGEEFDWFIDPRVLTQENAIREQAYGGDEAYEEVLASVPWQIYRNNDIVDAIDEDTRKYLDENAPRVTGRGFVDADWSETGTKVVVGLGELGALDLKKSPDEITGLLEENFESAGIGNRTTYRGSFQDEGREQEYEVIIGQNGSNLIWAADRPDESVSPPFLGDLETGYEVLENTAAGDRESIIDANGYGPKIVKTLQAHFPNEKDDLGFVIRAQESEGDIQAPYGMGDWSEESYLSTTGAIIEKDGEYEFFVEDGSPSQTPVDELAKDYDCGFDNSYT